LGNKINDQAIKNLYSYYARNKALNELSPITRLRYEKILDVLEKYRISNKVIDVGCGAGHFIMCAVEKGWQVDGSEISDEAIKLVKNKGYSIFKGDIASIDLEKEKYDAVTLFEFIEHAADPDGIIAKLSYALRPGGVIYITTPNYNSLTRKILGNRWGVFHMEHQFYYTPKVLISILKKHNFKILKLKTENLSVNEIMNIFKRQPNSDDLKCCSRRESVRHLIEYNILFFAIKKLINFFLNMCKAGETIYVFAVKG